MIISAIRRRVISILTHPLTHAALKIVHHASVIQMVKQTVQQQYCSEYKSGLQHSETPDNHRVNLADGPTGLSTRRLGPVGGYGSGQHRCSDPNERKPLGQALWC
jgi:hypothetical protein